MAQIKAGAIPCVILVKDGTVLPHLALAQSTKGYGLVQNRVERLLFWVKSRGDHLPSDR